jgi:folylpolyglutamate synthase
MRYRVLIFSHFSEERDGVTLMESLARALAKHDAKPDHVIFTTYQEREDGYTRIGKSKAVYALTGYRADVSYVRQNT